MDWRELQDKVNRKQAGMETDPTKPDREQWLEGWDENAPNAQEDYERRFFQNMFGNRTQKERYQEMRNTDIASMLAPEDVTQAVIDTGYGDVESDYDIPFTQWVENPVDYRSYSQSPAKKILFGAGKMLVYAGTTYLDNTAGLVAGLMGIRDDILEENPNLSWATSDAGLGLRKEREGAKPLNSFIDTPFSEEMQRWRDGIDQLMPIYRTQEEIENADEWWKYINANFWGDTFIKNFGFTLGAALSGATFAKGFKGARQKIADRAYKAALAASEGDAEAAAAFQKVLQGGKMQSAEKIYDIFEETQNSFKRLNTISQIVGGVGGALGESRMEALLAAKEFRDDVRMKATQEYEEEKKALAESIVSNPDFITDGQVNEKGLLAYEQGLVALQDKYNNALSGIDDEATRLANTTFAFNMPLLTASNIVMFGRMFTGGYKTQAKSLVNGTFGNYTPKGKLPAIGKTIANVIKNSGTEGLEELSQKIISEGSKSIGFGNIAAFHNKQYDKDALRDVSEMVLDFMSSAGDVLVDPKSWEEFAVGALTGAIGMPSHLGFSRWSGGTLGAIQEGVQEYRDSNRLAGELNSMIRDENFQNLFANMVRHRKLESLKNDDLASGNEFAWHTHDDEQLMNAVMTFADAGKLSDLEAYADSFANITAEEFKKIKPLLKDDTMKPGEFDRTSDEYKMNWLKERADALKKTINQYRNFYNSIDYLAFGTTNPAAIKELVFSQAQLQNFENRYNDILDKVLAKVRPELEEAALEKKQDGTPTEKAKRAKELLAAEDGMRRLFGGFALDLKARAQDANPSELSTYFRMIDNDRQAAILKDLEDLGVFSRDRVTKQEVEDLQKLVLARQNYYAKLFDPKGRQTFAESFKKDAVKPEVVAEDLEKDARKKTVQDVVSKLNAAKNFSEYVKTLSGINIDPESQKQLDEILDKDPGLRKHQKRLEGASDFVGQLGNAINGKKNNVSPDSVGAVSALLDAYDLFSNDMNVLAALPEGEDDAVNLAKAFLSSVSGNPRAYAMASAIIKEILGDRAQAAGLGSIPPGAGPGAGGGEGSGGGQGGGTGGGGNGRTAQQVENDIIDKINVVSDYNDTVLNNLANGVFDDFQPDILDDQKKAELSAMALEKLNELKRRAGILSGDGGGDMPVETDDDKDPVAKQEAREDFLKIETSSLTTRPSVYDTSLLPKGVMKPNTRGGERQKATIAWYMNHNVQDFIDTGALAKLSTEYERIHAKDEDESKRKLPIYFIANPHFVENNLVNNPFISQTTHNPTVLLAVEMNDEAKRILKDYDGTVIRQDTLVTVNEGGRNVQYQVIGEVWSPEEAEVNKHASDGYLDAYRNVREEAQRIWRLAIRDSIMPHYKADQSKGGNFTEEGRWYVARVHPNGATNDNDVQSANWNEGERLSTTLNYIMSGRNIVKDSANAPFEKTSLSTALADYKRYGGKYHFALQRRPNVNDSDNGVTRSPGAPSFYNKIRSPQGSLWIATREANGAYAWSYVTIMQADEFAKKIGFDKTNLALVKRLNDAIDMIFTDMSVSSDYQSRRREYTLRMQGVKTLTEMFHFGQGNRVQLDFSNGPAVIIAGAYCKNREEVLNALVAGKFRFQVSKNDVENYPNGRLDELIDAGVLQTDMKSFIRRGATFGANFMIDTDAEGKPVTPYPKKSYYGIAMTAGENVARVHAALSGGVLNIRIGEIGYSIDGDGVVRRMSSRLRIGEEVTDKATIASVKAIAELMSSESASTPYPGSKWIISDKFQYTEMFERDMNGVIVHMIRRGKGKKIELVFSDDEWNALMDTGAAVPSKHTYGKPQKEGAESTVSDDEMYQMYAADAAEREGGQPGGEQPQRRRRRSMREIMFADESPDESPTVQEAERNGIREESEIDCG